MRSYPIVYLEILFAYFMAIVSVNLSAGFLSLFANELDQSGILVGFAVSAWYFLRIFVELPSGILADRFGMRRLVIVGLGLSLAGAFFCYMANSIYLLIIGRGLWGLGTSLYLIGITAVIMGLFSQETRGRALGIFQGTESIAGLVGVPIGSIVAAIFNYQNTFFLALLLTFCCCLMTLACKGLQETNARIEVPRTSMRKSLSSLWNWKLIVICIAYLSTMLVMNGVMGTIFPIYLNSVLMIDQQLIGTVLTSRIAGAIFASVTSGYLSDLFGRKPMIVLGMLMQSCCLLLYTKLSTFEMLLLVGCVHGFGNGMSLTCLAVLLSEVAQTEVRGSAIGLSRTFMDLGGIVGPPLLMLLFRNYGSSFALLSGIAAFALSIALLMTIRERSIR